MFPSNTPTFPEKVRCKEKKIKSKLTTAELLFP